MTYFNAGLDDFIVGSDERKAEERQQQYLYPASVNHDSDDVSIQAT
jgi:hypothetical protein